MNYPIFDKDRRANAFSYSTDMLSIFREEKEDNKTIKPGMTAEELSEIISDRLIEIVKKNLKLEQKDEKEIGIDKT